MSTLLRARGVVVRSAGAPARVEPILVEPPAAGEVLVRVLATGVCHTDLHAQRGDFGARFPYLLGHEATGVIEQLGEGVTSLSLGQEVMLTWRAPCGRCPPCRAGRLSHCHRPRTAGPRLHTEDGQPLGRVLGLGTFATHTVVAEGQAIALEVVPGQPALAPEATCLIGCAVATGVGSAMYAAKVAPGSTVAVFGCGAVGLSVVQGARLCRAARIIAIDRVAGKLDAARTFGATDVVDASTQDPSAAIQELTARRGVDHAFEAIGLPETLEQALSSCGLGGECVLIGVPAREATLALSMTKLFHNRLTLRSTFYGDIIPDRDFPLLAAWYRSGALDLDALVSERIGLDDVEGAFERMRAGRTIRSVILPDPHAAPAERGG